MKKLLFTILIIILGSASTSALFVFGQSDSAIDSEISALNEKIQLQKQQMDQLSERQKDYQNKISEVSQQKNTLLNQLSVLDSRISKTELDLEKANLNIEKTNLEIRRIEIDVKNTDDGIETEKDHIANLLRLVYKQNTVSDIEMLLLNGSLAEFLNQAKYLENTNTKIKESLDSLRDKKEQLDKSKLSLAAKVSELAILKKELENKKENIAFEKDSKNIILDETKSSEAQYQNLLAQAKKEQLQAEAEVSSLEKSVRNKMAEKDKVRLNSGSASINWPVDGHYITTGFHDPDYPYRKIIGEHPAIDIRAPQGSTLRAAGDGYVAKVKFDGSTSYAYIMIIHKDGLSTVYGHVSAVSVKVDDYVHQGDAIGRTGAMPHTPGAGPFTTGPHLHFEVRKDGLPVNPLDYLP